MLHLSHDSRKLLVFPPATSGRERLCRVLVFRMNYLQSKPITLLRHCAVFSRRPLFLDIVDRIKLFPVMNMIQLMIKYVSKISIILCSQLWIVSYMEAECTNTIDVEHCLISSNNTDTT